MGLNAGLLLYVICFSGTIAVFSNELDWLVDADVRRVAHAPDAPPDWTAMMDSLDARYPGAANLGVYLPGASGILAQGDRVAAMAFVSTPDGRTRKVHLDPATGDILSDRSFFNAQRFFRSFHRRFFDGNRGIIIVTLSGFVLLASVLTGFFFYKGWLKQLVTLRLFRGARLRWSDLHKATGIWGLLFSSVIALTGVFYFVEVLYQGADAYGRLLPPPMEQVDTASLIPLGHTITRMDASEMARRAQQAIPELRIRSMRISNHPDVATYLDGQAGNFWTRDRADKVHVHPVTGEVLDVQRSSELTPVPFLTDAVDPLHFGYIGGIWTKIIWFLFGVMLCFSILAGLRLWIIRTSVGRSTRSWWLRGSMVSVLITVGYLMYVATVVVSGIRSDYGPSRTPVMESAVTSDSAGTVVGPWRVRVECHAPCSGFAGTWIGVMFHGERMPNYASVAVSTDGTDWSELAGPARRPAGSLKNEATGNGLHVRVVDRSGSEHDAIVPVSWMRDDSAEADSDRFKPAWPDTAPGVWWVIVVFAVSLVGSLVMWLVWLRKAVPQG